MLSRNTGRLALAHFLPKVATKGDERVHGSGAKLPPDILPLKNGPTSADCRNCVSPSPARSHSVGRRNSRGSDAVSVRV